MANNVDPQLLKKVKKALKQKVKSSTTFGAPVGSDLGEADLTKDFSKTVAGATSLKPDEDTNSLIASRGLIRASQGEVLTGAEREALSGYIELFTTIITTPSLRARLKNMQKLVASKDKKEPKDDSAKDE